MPVSRLLSEHCPRIVDRVFKSFEFRIDSGAITEVFRLVAIQRDSAIDRDESVGELTIDIVRMGNFVLYFTALRKLGGRSTSNRNRRPQIFCLHQSTYPQPVVFRSSAIGCERLLYRCQAIIVRGLQAVFGLLVESDQERLVVVEVRTPECLCNMNAI